MSGGNPKWYFNSSADPFKKDPSATWAAYSAKDNQLIEEAFKNKAVKVDLDNHSIHFHERMQVHKADFTKQRPVKREPKE